MSDETKLHLAELRLAELRAADHGAVNGMHTHAHPSYGVQGGDRSHEHMHRHEGDARHSHHRVTSAAGWPAGSLGFVAEVAETPARENDEPGLVAAAMTELGSPWGIEEEGDEWVVLDVSGERGRFVDYHEAVGALGGLAFVDARPVLTETWRSDMAFEDLETGDGRYIAPGALRYRDMPLPLMLQTTTDSGHFGAVLAGSITSAATSGGTAVGSGEFDDNDAGRQALDVIAARGRFGVSIDGMSPAEAEFECTEHDEEGECATGRMRFNLLTIGGLTMTPFPAFEDAFIAIEQRAATAGGEPEPCTDCDQEAVTEALPASAKAVSGSDTRVRNEPDPVVAAGGPLLPPAEWFEDPGFEPGDGRTLRQPDGQWLCPLTIAADGRVYGHMYGWRSCHTGIVDRCQTPPRSPSGFAYFNRRPIPVTGGGTAHVGVLSMGCGHAGRDLDWERAQAHYDGGPGAVQMADVHAGSDAHGAWFAGALRPAVTEEQVRAFQACSVSGDWREVQRNRGLDLVACLAGVTVPGFMVTSSPVMASLVAAADLAGGLPTEPVAFFRDGRAVSLVAAGVVRQPMPWERQVGELTAGLEAMSGRMEALERIAAPLLPLAVERLVASVEPEHEHA